jgi:hypothetical protein
VSTLRSLGRLAFVLEGEGVSYTDVPNAVLRLARHLDPIQDVGQVSSDTDSIGLIFAPLESGSMTVRAHMPTP